MRTIKFRAWDKTKEKMGTPFEPLKEMSNYNTDQNVYDRFPKTCEFMQFTGLLDKNGKEICEGDIVRGVNPQSDAPHGQSEVFYGYGQWQPFSYLGTWDGNNFEIIGNIYENPELLK